MEAGRLCALLMQFPWSFRNEPDNRFICGACATALPITRRWSRCGTPAGSSPMCWMNSRSPAWGLSNIDQPLFHRSVKPAALTTSSIGYVRLHGRNYQQWFLKKAQVRARYGYLYSPQEFEPWVDRIRTVAEDAEDTYANAQQRNLLGWLPKPNQKGHGLEVSFADCRRL